MTVAVNFSRTGLPDTTLVDSAVRELAGSGAPDDSATASKTVASGGANNDLTFTAVVAGPDGNNLRVAVVQQTGASKAAAIAVDTSSGWLGTILLPTAAPVAATLAVASTGAKNDLTFTAKATGVGGNALQVAVVQATAPSTVLSVAYSAGLATITLPADSGGDPVAATAAQVKTAWDLSTAFAAMTVAYEGTGAGTVEAAVAASLTGGDNGGEAVALTATAAKTLWDASTAVATATVAFEGDGSGTIAAAAAANFTGGAGTGTGFAGTGSRYTRTSNGKLYLNGGTATAPAWKLVTSA